MHVSIKGFNGFISSSDISLLSYAVWRSLNIKLRIRFNTGEVSKLTTDCFIRFDRLSR